MTTRHDTEVAAEVERRAADVVLPLLKKHGLMPRDKSVLKALGEVHVERHRHFSWMEMMEYMVGRYPAYLDEFEALERLAPEDDITALKLLTHHEVVAIDFAKKEIALDPDSMASLQEYLDYSIA